jgi:hypothetical protein
MAATLGYRGGSSSHDQKLSDTRGSWFVACWLAWFFAAASLGKLGVRVLH